MKINEPQNDQGQDKFEFAVISKVSKFSINGIPLFNQISRYQKSYAKTQFNIKNCINSGKSFYGS